MSQHVGLSSLTFSITLDFGWGTTYTIEQPLVLSPDLEDLVVLLIEPTKKLRGLKSFYCNIQHTDCTDWTPNQWEMALERLAMGPDYKSQPWRRLGALFGQPSNSNAIGL